MTNAEKYKEIFGFEPPNCPTWHCPSCPIFKDCVEEYYNKPVMKSEHHFVEMAYKWWNSEYKEGNNN